MREMTLKVFGIDSPMKLNSYLKSRKNISMRFVRMIKYKGGSLLLNGSPAKFIEKVNDGDEIKIIFPSEVSHFKPENMELKILYEDDDFIAVNKPPHIVVHPTKSHQEKTLANAISFYEKKMNDENKSYELFKIRFANRLDMDTSGIVLSCKNAFAQDNFSKQNTEKKYFAIVKGFIKEGGLIDAPIKRPELNSIKRVVSEDGKESRTLYKPVKNFKYKDEDLSLVEIELLTGRTHQIRVHFSYIGHPIFGDELYGGGDAHITRQLLHAYSLKFVHPFTEKEVSIICELPEDFNEVLGAQTLQPFKP